MKYSFKLTAIILIQVFLMMPCARAHDFNSSVREPAALTTLAPKAAINIEIFQDGFSRFIRAARENAPESTIKPARAEPPEAIARPEFSFFGYIARQAKAWSRVFSLGFIVAVLQVFSGVGPSDLSAAQRQNMESPAEVRAGRYAAEMIPGTNIVIHTHTGRGEGKHNNVLADWAEANINGTLQPESDLVRFDWHADDRALIRDEQIQAWRDIRNINDPARQIEAARQLARQLRIDAFNYPAFLTGPRGKPMLRNTVWVRQPDEWTGAPREEGVVFLDGIMLFTDNPSAYPNAKKSKRFSLNIGDLSAMGAKADIKSGFALDFDLDYFALYTTENVDWDLLNKTLVSDNVSSRRLAAAVLKAVYFRPDRGQIQKNIDAVLEQLSVLAEQGKTPSIITIAQSPGFTPEDDSDWIQDRLVAGLIKIYSQDGSGRKRNLAPAKMPLVIISGRDPGRRDKALAVIVERSRAADKTLTEFEMVSVPAIEQSI